MTTPPGKSPSGDPLEPVLRDVEAELRQRLREACDAEASGISNDGTEEIRRLESSLLSAAVAAEQTIALRRHIERRSSASAEAGSLAGAPDASGTPNDLAAPISRVREFRDASGQQWRAWPVKPGQARPGRTTGRYLGDFHQGWVCFEALESPARRRLPGQPANWMELPDSELMRLLEDAISAPLRKTSA